MDDQFGLPKETTQDKVLRNISHTLMVTHFGGYDYLDDVQCDRLAHYILEDLRRAGIALFIDTTRVDVPLSFNPDDYPVT